MRRTVGRRDIPIRWTLCRTKEDRTAGTDSKVGSAVHYNNVCVCVYDNKQKGRQQQVPTSTAVRENIKKISSFHVKPPTQSVFSSIILLYPEYILGRLLYSSRVERNTWDRFGTGTNGQVAVRQYTRN